MSDVVEFFYSYILEQHNYNPELMPEFSRDVLKCSSKPNHILLCYLL